MVRLFCIFVCGVLSIQSSVSAETVDTLNSVQLQNVEIRGKHLRSYLKQIDGASIINMSLMDEMPHILGNADPMHYAQLQPGVQTNSEYDAGLHIQGCDNSHNWVSLGGVPIYNAAHLLGFFSIFNAGQFSDMMMQKTAVAADFPNRLGGSLNMRTPTWILLEDSLYMSKTHGEISVGPMSSQGTLRLPVGNRSLLLLSARAAYLNLLYSKWLEVDGDEVKYDFSDYNLSFISQQDESNAIKLETYWGYDNMKIGQGAYALNGRLKWGNSMLGVHWYARHETWQMEHLAYFSHYANHLNINEFSFDLGVKSCILDFGYKGSVTAGRWSLGTELIHHRLSPQDISLEGNLVNYSSDTQRQNTWEMSAYCDYGQSLGSSVMMNVGARFSGYHNQSLFYHINPHLKLHWQVSPILGMTFIISFRHQYLFQTGFSSAGLPTEFWFSSSEQHRPQKAFNLSWLGEVWFANREYRLSGEVYVKWLRNQLESSGNLFDVLYSAYSYDTSLLHGKGINMGVNFLLEKRRGKLTGWLSYSLGRARRKFDGEDYQGWYPANHERIHELNVVATYRLGKKCSVGATYVFASGTPYTQVKDAYLVANNLVAEYGPHNGNRVAPYMRLDLSMNYDFLMRSGKRSGINFSLYNATMHGNDLFYRIKVYKDHVSYRAFRFVMPIMPSISYYYKF